MIIFKNLCLISCLLISLSSYSTEKKSEKDVEAYLGRLSAMSTTQLKKEINKQKDSKLRRSGQEILLRILTSDDLKNENLDDVRKQANTLIKMMAPYKNDQKEFQTYVTALHYANIVLGRVNLREGKIEEAKTNLAQATNIKGSASLTTFGPKMTLAKELLEKGEKDAVIQFIHDCVPYWDLKNVKSVTENWIKLIKEGKMPSFQAVKDGSILEEKK